MSDQTESTQQEPPEPAPAPAPASTQDEPPWVGNFFQRLDEKLDSISASVTDDDKRSIAESVHGLFEGSGAFEPATEPRKDETQQQQQQSTQQESQPQKRSKLKGFAARFQGED